MARGVIVALLSCIVLAQCQSDLCTTNCTGGVEDDLFSAAGYGTWGQAYVRDSQVPPIRAAHSAAITTAIIIIHGNNRDAYNYYCYMKYAVSMVNRSDSTFIVAPHFMLYADGPAPNAFYWVNSAAWKEGGKSDMSTTRIPSFQILDDMLLAFDNRTYFPGLQEILIVGHSAGAQTAQRYAIATGIEKSISVPIRYIIENAGSYAYLDTNRAVLPTLTLPTCTACNSSEIPTQSYTFQAVDHVTEQSCSVYNQWKMGIDSGNVYLNKRSATVIRSEYQTKHITYVLGTGDTCNTALGDCGCDDSDLDTGCDAEMQGYCRFERGVIFYRYLTFFYGSETHKMVFVSDLGHNGCGTITSEPSLLEMFPEVPTNPPTNAPSDSPTTGTPQGGSSSSGHAGSTGVAATTGSSGSSRSFTATVNFTGPCAGFDAGNVDLGIVGTKVTLESCTTGSPSSQAILLITVPSSSSITTSQVETGVRSSLELAGYRDVTVRVQEGSDVSSANIAQISMLMVALLLIVYL